MPSIAIIVRDHNLDKNALVDQLVEIEKEFSDDCYNEWFCINIKPFQCTTCGVTICYCVAGPHYILIFPTRDDDDILQMAQILQEDGNYEPNITRYNHMLGPCVSWPKALEFGWMEI